MKFEKHIPDPSLEPLVAHYWTLSSAPGERGTHFRFVPDGYVDWIFHEKDPWSFRYSTDSPAFHQHRNHIFGHTKSFIDIQLGGEMKLFGVKFKPESAHWVWGKGMHETSNLGLSDIDIQNEIMIRLADRLANEEDNQARVNVCNDAFASAMQKADPDLKLAQVMENHTKANVGKRRVQQLFKELVGISSGTLHKTKRVNDAISRLWSQSGQSLTELAYDLGYSDQAHFIREFKSFTSMSPGRFLKSINPDGEILNLKAE